MALAAGASAHAQAYPSKPLEFVIGFPAGGPTDVIAALQIEARKERRIIGFVLSCRMACGQDFAGAVCAAPCHLYTCRAVGGFETTLERERIHE